MIGVAYGPSEEETVREFFELFKTPWEPARPGHRYPVVLSTVGLPDGVETPNLLLFGATPCPGDHPVPPGALSGPTEVEWDGRTFPLYAGALSFVGDGRAVLWTAGRPLDFRGQVGGSRVWRIGYNLFAEVRHLLTLGQPPSRALVPTLELHIALLRHLVLESGVPFVEIPPCPAGYDFICCLTHDIDFFGITRHLLDRTFAGFVARASLGTLAGVVRGRRPPLDALENFRALLSLPFVYTGLARDFWQPLTAYAREDRGRPSTFFVVPFRDRPGVDAAGRVATGRAVKYQASEIGPELKRAAQSGHELAVHGIDAWRDARAGREELEQLLPLTGGSATGVRMHWLYFSETAPRELEAAGFDYDSTCGYNEAVGYRAGTGQAFRLPGTERLMELPMCLMDSAMFFPGRMNLPRKAALALGKQIVSNARRFGGTVVVNWHDRSTAPERLWGGAYQDLLDEIQQAGRVWYATAAEAVEWFRWRRSIRFVNDPLDMYSPVDLAVPVGRHRFTARLHAPASAHVDRPLEGPVRIEIAPAVRAQEYQS